MKNVELINKTIHEKIITRPFVNWYRVSELSEGQYEIKFYINFFEDDENDMKIFESDVKALVKAIEDNALIKIENNYHILVISDLDIIDNSVLEITTICEKIV